MTAVQVPIVQAVEGHTGDVSQTFNLLVGVNRTFIGLAPGESNPNDGAHSSQRVKEYYAKRGMKCVRTAEDVARFRERQRERAYRSAAARRERAALLADSDTGKRIVADVSRGFSLRETARRQNVRFAFVLRVVRAFWRHQARP